MTTAPIGILSESTKGQDATLDGAEGGRRSSSYQVHSQGLYADNMPCNVMYTDQTVRAAGGFRSNGSQLLCPGQFFSPIESPLDHVPIELLVVTWRCIGNKLNLDRADPKRGSRCSPTPRHVQRWERTSVIVRYSIRLLTIGLPNMLAGELYALASMVLL
ncbi:hypothetical protein CI102_7380 [Trichoderma harzianum]|nr:hypothetical protein CI102_7380 [Trichoderma harzianum]